MDDYNLIFYSDNQPDAMPMINRDSIDDTDNPSITVGWDQLTPENGLQYLETYIVRVIEIKSPQLATNRRKRETTETVRTFNVSKDRNSFILTGIEPYTAYTIDVLAELLVDGKRIVSTITQPQTVVSSETGIHALI